MEEVEVEAEACEAFLFKEDGPACAGHLSLNVGLDGGMNTNDEAGRGGEALSRQFRRQATTKYKTKPIEFFVHMI